MTFTYAEVGATRSALLDGAPLPAGYDHVLRHVPIKSEFRTAADALARWEPQWGAGLKVRTDADRAAAGVRFATGLGAGPLRLWAPCEVVWLVDEPDRYVRPQAAGARDRPLRPRDGARVSCRNFPEVAAA